MRVAGAYRQIGAICRYGEIDIIYVGLLYGKTAALSLTF